jgi:hypothetical protein
MATTAALPNPTPDKNWLHAQFLSILPRIELHAHIYFRNVKCPQRRADLIAETIAHCWKWFVELAGRGKDATRFPATLAYLASRHVKNGRRVCGKEPIDDVMSTRAQYKHGFLVQSLPQYETGDKDNEALDALRDNTRTPPPEQVAFRLDFPAWRQTRTERDRRVIDELMRGERTKDVSRRHGLTAGRISQLRRDFHHDWNHFCGDDDSDQSRQAA